MEINQSPTTGIKQEEFKNPNNQNYVDEGALNYLPKAEVSANDNDKAQQNIDKDTLLRLDQQLSMEFKQQPNESGNLDEIQYKKKEKDQDYNPYTQFAINDNDKDKEEESDPMYTVQKGDSLMKIAYMHNVSERSIKQLNNLLTPNLVPGQVIKLPIQQLNRVMHSNEFSGNHIDINQITDKGTKRLIGSQDSRDQQQPGKMKNTNNQQYVIEAENDRQEGLNSFLNGFQNLNVTQQDKDEIQNAETQSGETSKTSSQSQGMLGRIFETYNYITKSEKIKQDEEDIKKKNYRKQSYNPLRRGTSGESKEINMNVVGDEKVDPSMRKVEPTFYQFDVNDYVTFNNDPNYESTFGSANIESSKDFYMKTECFYMIKFEKVYGTLIVKKDKIIFEPQDPEDRELINSGKTIYNDHLVNDEDQIKIQDYGGQIDFMDVIEVNKMSLVNEKAIVSENNFVKEAYKYNYFLQVVLTAVNGVTLRKQDHWEGQTLVEDDTGASIADDSGIIKRNQIPIANIYFKTSHFDQGDARNGYGETALTNKYQEQVIDELYQKLEKKIQMCKQLLDSDESNTYVPYYDSIIDKKQKGQLGEVKMNSLLKARMDQHNTLIKHINTVKSKKNQSQRKISNTSSSSWDKMGPSIQSQGSNQDYEPKIDHSSLIDSQMIEYMPKKNSHSGILSDLQMSNLIRNFPAYQRQSDWNIAFRMDQDGTSLLTFFKKTRDLETTVLICEDEHGHKFGAYCTEPWKMAYRFFGNSQNFLYTFQDKDEVKTFVWQGTSEQIMYADNKTIGLGGSHVKGRFAFYLSSDLFHGSSCKTECYENDILSKNTDFKCYKLEVWQIDD